MKKLSLSTDKAEDETKAEEEDILCAKKLDRTMHVEFDDESNTLRFKLDLPSKLIGLMGKALKGGRFALEGNELVIFLG